MSPDICLVNFYNSSGRLGLHQVQNNHFLWLC
jgi:alkylated DNA repair dioxygenase AlkB